MSPTACSAPPPAAPLSANVKTTAKLVQRSLNQLYPNPAIPLKHHSKFTLLVAVLLSAHSTDKAVNNVTPQLFKQANNVQALQTLPLKTVEAIIRPCGLAPQKAKALKGLAAILCTQYNGKVPGNFAALEALPGVGHKTASVVMLQGFGVAAFPVDTHIHRLAARWGLSSGKNVTKTEADLKCIFPQKLWGKLHLQFIYFGREYCKARYHERSACPICSQLPFVQHSQG